MHSSGSVGDDERDGIDRAELEDEDNVVKWLSRTGTTSQHGEYSVESKDMSEPSQLRFSSAAGLRREDICWTFLKDNWVLIAIWKQRTQDGVSYRKNMMYTRVHTATGKKVATRCNMESKSPEVFANGQWASFTGDIGGSSSFVNST